MTRKDYKLLAEAIRQVPSEGAWTVWYGVVTSIAAALASDNPRFDPDKFYAACGIAKPQGDEREAN